MQCILFKTRLETGNPAGAFPTCNFLFLNTQIHWQKHGETFCIRYEYRQQLYIPKSYARSRPLGPRGVYRVIRAANAPRPVVEIGRCGTGRVHASPAVGRSAVSGARPPRTDRRPPLENASPRRAAACRRPHDPSGGTH